MCQCDPLIICMAHTHKPNQQFGRILWTFDWKHQCSWFEKRAECHGFYPLKHEIFLAHRAHASAVSRRMMVGPTEWDHHPVGPTQTNGSPRSR